MNNVNYAFLDKYLYGLIYHTFIKGFEFPTYIGSVPLMARERKSCMKLVDGFEVFRLKIMEIILVEN